MEQTGEYSVKSDMGIVEVAIVIKASDFSLSH